MKERRIEVELPAVRFYPIKDLPSFKPGDNIAEAIEDALERSGIPLEEKDILAVTAKVVSKAEGRIVNLNDYDPTLEALKIAAKTGRDPRLVQAILEESRELILITPGSQEKPGIIVTRHRLGHVCTSAGIDKTNIGVNDPEKIILLPEDPDESAREIVQHFFRRYRINVGVVIVDSMGDPYRAGAIGKALGVANVPARIVKIQERDLDGKSTKSDVAFADAIAAFAMLLMGQTDQGIPVVLIKGLDYPWTPGAKISDVLL